MKCPRCGSQNYKLTDTRQRKRGYIRWRKCLDCGNTYTTIECLSKKSLREVMEWQK